MDHTTNLSISQYFSWTTVAYTHTGNVRSINEDAIMINPEQGHWVVADGMGGHNAGDLASSSICEALKDLNQHDDVPAFIDQLEDTIDDVNQMLFSRGNATGSVIGSTVIGMVFNGHHMISYWAGDSRGYVYRNGRLKQVTVDHSEVQELLDAGVITPEQAFDHPEKNVITRAVGSGVELLLDFTIEEVRDKDIFIVCSDGIDKELSDTELESLLGQPHQSLESALDMITSEVLSRGARDNLSLVLIQFEQSR